MKYDRTTATVTMVPVHQIVWGFMHVIMRASIVHVHVFIVTLFYCFIVPLFIQLAIVRLATRDDIN